MWKGNMHFKHAAIFWETFKKKRKKEKEEKLKRKKILKKEN